MSIQPRELATIIKSEDLCVGRDYLVVDVRRTDFEVGLGRVI